MKLSPEEAAGPEVAARALRGVARVRLSDVRAAEASKTAGQLASGAAGQQDSKTAGQPARPKKRGQASAEAHVGTLAKPYRRRDGIYTRPLKVVIDVRVINGLDDYLRPQVRAGRTTLAAFVEAGLRHLIEERWMPDREPDEDDADDEQAVEPVSQLASWPARQEAGKPDGERAP